ncbi:MAG: glycosyltransferase family 39 protein, partial [Nitrospinota bacterium]
MFAALLFLYGLGATSLQDNDETRFGLIARTMMQTGDWVVPRWSHRPQGTKPPFFMWAIAGFSAVSGRVTSWSARLPSALAGVGVVLLTYFLGRRLFPRPVPFLAGLVVGANLAFYESARTAQTDMLLVFFVLLAATLALEGHARRGALCYILVPCAYAAAGLAVLTKGPVGLLLPGFIVLSVLVARGGWKKFPFLPHLAGLAVAVAVAGAWYVLYQESVGGEAARQSVIRENFFRYLSGFDHRRPVYYFVHTFAAEFMPWTPVFLLSLGWAWANRKSNAGGYGAVLLWMALIFVFFSFSASKRSQYILPLYPAAALMTAAFLAAAFSPGGEAPARWRMAGLWTYRAVAFAAMGLGVGGSVLAAFRFRPYLVPAVAGGVLVAAFGAWMLRETFRLSSRRVIWVIPVGFLFIHLIVQPIAAPHLERRKSPRPYAREVAGLVGGHHLVSYRYSRASLAFYAPPEMGEVFYVYGWDSFPYFFRDHQEPVYVLMSRENFQALPREALAGSRVLRRNLRYR